MKKISETYSAAMESFYMAEQLLQETITDHSARMFEEFQTVLNRYGTRSAPDPENPDLVKYRIPVVHHNKVNRAQKQINSLGNLARFMPRSLVVALVSQIDILYSDLLRFLYDHQPEMLKASAQKIDIEQALSFSTIEELRAATVDKEVETLLRENHYKQIDLLESRFSVPLKKDLDLIYRFIELAERRNLFVHTDGIVNDQYVINLSKIDPSRKPAKEKGARLAANPEYVKASIDLAYEYGIKLIQTLWRKHVPSESSEADDQINSITYRLIYDQRYDLALRFLDFATTPPVKITDLKTERYILLNKAQALKWSGKTAECAALLSSVSWSGFNNVILLAKSALEEDFDRGFALMKKVLESGDLLKEDLKEWPIFRDLRKQDRFLEVYKEHFGEDYEEVEEPQREDQSEIDSENEE